MVCSAGISSQGTTKENQLNLQLSIVEIRSRGGNKGQRPNRDEPRITTQVTGPMSVRRHDLHKAKPAFLE